MELLRERYVHRIEYLRISLTDRCNMRCRYCMPNGSPDSVKSQESFDAMEALRGVAAVLLSVYDMIKSQDKGDHIVSVALDMTSGGRSSEWMRG